MPLDEPKTQPPSSALEPLHPGRIHAKVQATLARVRGGELTPACVARSVAWGVFIGATPLYGLHTILSVLPAIPFRLDPLVAYISSNISLPPMIPILLYAEVQVGNLILRGETLPIAWRTLSPEQFTEVSTSLVVGTLVVGSSLAAMLSTVGYLVARAWFGRHRASTE